MDTLTCGTKHLHQDYCHTCKAWITAQLDAKLPDPAYVCPHCRKILFELAVEIRRYQEGLGTRAAKPAPESLFENL